MLGTILKWVTMVLAAIMRLPLLDFIPKGYLTKAAAVLQVIAGVGVLASQLAVWVETGTAPPLNLELMFGTLLLGNGAASAGIRRAVE